MPDPVPTEMDADQITAITMDCIVRAKEADPEIDADDQKSQSNLTIESDAKLLWKQPKFPYRAILFSGTRDNNGPSVPSFFDGFGMINASTFKSIPWGQKYVFEFTAGTGGHDGTYALASSGDTVLEGFDPTPYAWSVWIWGTPSGDVPVDGFTPKAAFITQVLCPNPVRSVAYEIWSVTVRVAQGLLGTEPGDDPIPYPWSDSSDFAKISSGTMHPGEIITIPCLVAQAPQAPPAPTSFTYPDGTEPYWFHWGVATYIVFPP